MKKRIIQIDKDKGSNRSFGIVFSVIFLIVALYPLTVSESYLIWALIVSVVFLFFSLFASPLLSFPNKLWFKLGSLLNSIISPLLMFLVYFLTVLPTGLIMRLLGRDLLRLKPDRSSKSYWIIRKEPMGPMKNQF